MYRPGFPPDDPAQLPSYLEAEQVKVLREFNDPKPFILLHINHSAPKAPSDPNVLMLAAADGTDWNPGSGAGLYRYQNNTWTFVG